MSCSKGWQAVLRPRHSEDGELALEDVPNFDLGWQEIAEGVWTCLLTALGDGATAARLGSGGSVLRVLTATARQLLLRLL